MTKEEEVVFEAARRNLVVEINSEAAYSEPMAYRRKLEAENGQVWDMIELSQDFEVQGFLAPTVLVKRKSDNVQGTMFFSHHPRFYWGFEPVK